MGALRGRLRLAERPWLALGVAVVVAAVFSALWLVRATAQYQPDPEPVPQGQPAVGEQATYTLRGMTVVDVIPAGSNSVPPLPNASYVAVVLDYSGTSTDDVVCLLELLGDNRYWTTERYASVRDWGYQSTCSGRDGSVLKFFEIPTTAVDEIRGIRVRGGGETLVLGGEVKVQ